jgi:hypothetical protein
MPGHLSPSASELINLMLVCARFLNVWDSLARLCIPKRYRFDEDTGSDDNTERGRLLLRQEQARTQDLLMRGSPPCWDAAYACWPQLFWQRNEQAAPVAGCCWSCRWLMVLL